MPSLGELVVSTAHGNVCRRDRQFPEQPPVVSSLKPQCFLCLTTVLVIAAAVVVDASAAAAACSASASDDDADCFVAMVESLLPSSDVERV